MTVQLHRGFLAQLQEFVRATGSLAELEAATALLDAAGWDLEVLAPADMTPIGAAVGALVECADSLETILAKPEVSLTDIADAIGPVAARVPALYDALSKAQFAGDIPAGAPVQMATDVANFLLISQLKSRLPRVAMALELLGFIKLVQLPEVATATPVRIVRRAMKAPQVDMAAVGALLHNPMDYVQTNYLSDPDITVISNLLGPIIADGNFRNLGALCLWPARRNAPPEME